MLYIWPLSLRQCLFGIYLKYCSHFSDVRCVVEALYPQDPPSIVLIGHRYRKEISIQAFIKTNWQSPFKMAKNYLISYFSDIVQVISISTEENKNLFFFILFDSMGGAVAIHVAAERLLSSLVGVVVIDVVEGIKQYRRKSTSSLS